MNHFEKESLGLFPTPMYSMVDNDPFEVIVLDTCDTGKAFAGLIRRAREACYKPEDNVLFVHTGGAGGLFAQEWDE